MDISESGIYVAAQYFSTGTIVDVTFPFRGRHITLKGQVRHCENGVGAGISFIDLNEDERAIVRQLIGGLTGTSAPEPTRGIDDQVQASLSKFAPKVILETLINLLRKKRIISEEELLSELNRTRERQG